MAEELLDTPAALPRRKKIVICCDGTGNEFGGPNPDPKNKSAGHNSNVVKLYTALEINNDQVGYYHPGVGTMGAPTATHWWSREWSKAKGLAFGAGFRDNVIDAYRYLMEVYNDNGGHGNEDEVYIFGFSRGAYTARALAGLLDGYGLLCRGNEGHIPYAWRMYVAQHGQRDQREVEPNESFKKTFSHKGFRIRFVGVWDTVSSVGWITTPLRLFNLAQNSTIMRGRHAISIDEHRCFFQDNLWGEPLSGQDLVQAWFAGVHSDVGGSYSQPDSGLSEITLRWMLDEVGLHALNPDRKAGEKAVYPAGSGVLLNEERYDLVTGKVPQPKDERDLYYRPPTLSKLHNSLTGAWWVLELIPRIYFNRDDAKKEQQLVPLGVRRRQLPHGALVHASVAERMDTPHFRYAPKNVSREELKRDEAAHPVPVSADGTVYYRFEPKDRKRGSLVWRLFDRYVATGFFWVFDVVVLLPFLVWVAGMIVVTVVGVVSVLACLLWHWALHCIPWAVRAVLYCSEHLLKWFVCWVGKLERLERWCGSLWGR